MVLDLWHHRSTKVVKCGDFESASELVQASIGRCVFGGLPRHGSARAALVLFTLFVGCNAPDSTSSTPDTVAVSRLVDTSALTNTERRRWLTLTSEVLAPCANHLVSVAQCVRERRPCAACAPAVRFLYDEVRAGKSDSQARAALRARFDPNGVRSIAIGESATKGPDSARVTLVVWSDFQCPACRVAAPSIADAAKRFPGAVRVVFKHYPLNTHEHAERAARAAAAAGAQGKFWEMHEALFASPQKLRDDGVREIATTLGLDLARFDADRASERVTRALDEDRGQADALGLRGVPMLYVNGRRFGETFDISRDLTGWIALELELAKRD
jgi:protein-disulfide isomerase